jgi:hypothetical protein
MTGLAAPAAPHLAAVQELAGKRFLLIGDGITSGDRVTAIDRYGLRQQRQIIEILPGHRAVSIPLPVQLIAA